MFGAVNTVTAVTLTCEPGSSPLTLFVGADADVVLHCYLRVSIGRSTIRGGKTGRMPGETTANW